MFEKLKFYTAISLSLLLILPSSFLSQEKDKSSKNKSVNKIASFADEAIGVQTKGELQNLTMNYGQITDTRYEDVGNAPTETFFNFRYPRENFTGLVDDFSIFFAIKENSENGDQGNVIEAWTDNDNEDWIAKDGAYGNTHYNPANDPTPHEELLYSGATPYLAHSDLTDTWPVDANGDPFWPGIFRRDPVTGQQIEGEFASDRDIYMEFTDANNQQGDVLGIEVHEMAYTYGRVYAQDMLFYEFWIINKSGKDLTGCYTGYYQDPDCSDYGEEILLVVDSTYNDGSKLFSLAQRDFDGDIGGATTANSIGVTEDFTFGTLVLETPDNLGVTDFHYFVDSGPTDDFKLWPIITSDPTNKNIAGESANYFHGDNQRMDDVSTITTPQDLVWIVASGPFDMAAGDTVKMTCAVVVGDNDADYYKNVWQAKELYDAKFNGPVAPPSPSLSVVPGDGKVTLYWDDSPETYIDPSTGENDFEGYKIYRSEDKGMTWGTKITDSKGGTYGYVPVAQFDLKNNITGNDPLNPLNYLGDDSGLQHSWVDENVVNGLTYSYTIVSYDHGTPTLYALEGTRGDGPEVHNFVEVIPIPDAIGTLPAEVNSVNHTEGRGEAEFSIEIIDAASLTGSSYEVTFQGTPAKTFSLTRKGNNEQILYSNVKVNKTDLPIVDGFQLSVATDSKIGGLKSILDGDGNNIDGSTHLSQDSSWYVTANPFASGDIEAKSNSYQIVFSEETSVAYSWGLSGSVAAFEVPFYILNKNTSQKIAFEVNDINANNSWDEGEIIFITRVPYPDPAPSIGSPNPATEATEFAYQVNINNAPNDAAGNPPTVGTVININSFNAVTENDTFEITFNGETFSEEAIDLSKIKVVPNPYIVVSKYETQQNVRQIRFMYLPPECTINIYTTAGTLVKTLHHNSGEGSLSWNLLTEWNQALAFGVYVYVVEDPYGNKHIDKFALIK